MNVPPHSFETQSASQSHGLSSSALDRAFYEETRSSKYNVLFFPYPNDLGTNISIETRGQKPIYIP